MTPALTLISRLGGDTNPSSVFRVNIKSFAKLGLFFVVVKRPPIVSSFCFIVFNLDSCILDIVFDFLSDIFIYFRLIIKDFFQK